MTEISMADAVSANTLEKIMQPEFKNFCLIILAVDIILHFMLTFSVPLWNKESLRKI